MLDIKIIRENPSLIQTVCNSRGVKADISMLLAVDAQRLKLQREFEQIRSEGNTNASKMKVVPDEERTTLQMKGSQLKKQGQILENLLRQVNEQYDSLIKSVPNLFAEDTPEGKDDEDNLELEVFGSKPMYDFDPKDHIQLGNNLGMDFEAGTRVAGSGFPLFRGSLALLENALLRFTQDWAIKNGFVPTNVPLLVKQHILEGLGFNPRREDEGTEIFSTLQDELCLAGTAEISLVGQYSDEIIDTSMLPIKMVALTPCFRREGSYGRRDAGLYRNKMFNKVELVVINDSKD